MPINLFKTVKAAVTTIEAAKFYGLEVSRIGMTRCPFHEDHTPSLKLDERYYCFGCQETGDVIDFTAKLFGISKSNAARKLAGDFGIMSDNKAVFKLLFPPNRGTPSGSALVFYGIICGCCNAGSCTTHRSHRMNGWMTVLWKPAKC